MSSGLILTTNVSQNFAKSAFLSSEDQLNAMIVLWNIAYVNSKDKAHRDMMMLRAKGEEGQFVTEGEALTARRKAAASLDGVDLVIEVEHAGLSAYQDLMNRYANPFGAEDAKQPDLKVRPAPAADLNTSGPQPFVEWGSHDDTGLPYWDALPSDTRKAGESWQGTAMHTNAADAYVKVLSIPFGHAYYRYFRQADAATFSTEHGVVIGA